MLLISIDILRVNQEEVLLQFYLQNRKWLKTTLSWIIDNELVISDFYIAFFIYFHCQFVEIYHDNQIISTKINLNIAKWWCYWYIIFLAVTKCRWNWDAPSHQTNKQKTNLTKIKNDKILNIWMCTFTHNQC